jgi:hypothetical protein
MFSPGRFQSGKMKKPPLLAVFSRISVGLIRALTASPPPMGWNS